jgi:hypothetical protein
MEAPVTSQFSIDITSWLRSSDGPDEFQQTTGLLQVTIGDKVVTRVEDGWSKSVQQFARVSAYPLALWIASSWWRLRWESQPFRTTPDVSWRMAHEMPGAGYGFLWPLVTFESDGEEISVVCRPSNPLASEPLQYLADFRETIEASRFEKTLDRFVSFVLARLEAVGIGGTHLHDLWSEVQEERTDPLLARGRKLEAQLGYEPGEAPDRLVQRLDALSHRAGLAAVEELAPVCAGPRPEETLARIEEFAELSGQEARVSLPCLPPAHTSDLSVPWERGWSLAREARRVCGFGDRAVSDEKLATLFDVPTETFQKPGTVTTRPPLGLAIRNGKRDRLTLLFRKRNRPALRFEAARFLAEQILVPKEDVWLPATDSSTARQKVQRAFAAEFLCPIDALTEFLNGDFSPEAIEEAGEQFGVSELAVKSHLANHGQIPFDEVTV